MKKTLALVLALAMVFSTITVAFAEGTISADAQICADLGMLKGETGTVDAAYTATTPTRLQSAVMFLRLKGLEAEALAFTGEANFADGNIAWAEGSNLLAYLKANPQLGWQGDGTNFNPGKAITAQEYYKVLVEALGYKQTTPEVVGDFAYADVLTFAASKGLSKVATVTNYTVNDLAIATVEALKANMKEGGKTLAATLVEAGKIDKAKAIAAGLYADAATTTAKLDTVSALGNAVVLVEFDADVEKAFAENVANYKIVEKGTDTAVEVKAAVLDSTEATLAVLDTAALTAGKAYTLTVGDVSKNFAGVAKDTSAPEIDEVEGTDTERVVVTFTTSMDMATALDTANYAIDGVTVESIAWDDADGARDAVELTTKGLVANRTYKVKVTNVKSVDGVVLKSDSMNFVATADKKAPKIDDDNTEAMTNTRILVTFSDDNEITKESAENLANYKITLGTGDNELEITAAKLVEDDNDDEKAVELTTVAQKGSQKYVIHVNNIVDTSVLANKMTKEDTATVYGKRADDDEPTFKAVEYLSDTLVQITFGDDSRLDFASAQDLNNYSMNNDVAIEKAELVDAEDADCMKVRLTVSELGDNKSYKVTVKNVADEYGNAMDEETKSKSFDKDEVMAVATVKDVDVTATNKIVLTFTKELDEASAEDVANYEIDDEIGVPKKAVYDEDDKTVTLTTPEMVMNHKYDLTIEGVKDIAGNIISRDDVDFVVSLDENDTDTPEIEDIEAVNSHVVRVTFNESIDVSGIAPKIFLDNDLTSSSNDDPSVTDAEDEKVNDPDVFGTYKVSTDDDDMVLEFYFTGALADEDVNLVSTTAADLAGNVCEDTYEFGTINDDPEAVELLSWDQVNVKKFELQFSEKVELKGTASATNTFGTSYTFTLEPDEDDDSLWYMTANKVMDADEEFNVNISDLFVNFHGFAVLDEDDEYNTTFTDAKGTGSNNKRTPFETGIEDEDEPYIEEVEATDRNTVLITFSEDMSYAGKYSINYVDKDGKDKTIPSITVGAPDDNEVELTFSTNLTSKYVYTLVVETQAKDLAGNKIDEDTEYDFAGTDVVAIDNYIEGIKVINGQKFIVSTYSKIDPDSIVATLVYGDDDAPVALATVNSVVGGPAENNDLAADGVTVEADDPTASELTFKLAAGYALADGETYTVSIVDNNETPVTTDDVVLFTYEIDGIVTDDLTVDKFADNDFRLIYDDAKSTDEVYVNGSATALAVSEFTATGEWKLGVANGAVINVLVTRNDVPLYYINQFDTDDAE